MGRFPKSYLAFNEDTDKRPLVAYAHSGRGSGRARALRPGRRKLRARLPSRRFPAVYDRPILTARLGSSVIVWEINVGERQEGQNERGKAEREREGGREREREMIAAVEDRDM